MKTIKANINYAFDILIAVGFIISLISGIILLMNPYNGFQGGRNPAFNQSILLLTKSAWKDVHSWSSILMAVGIFLHFVLHWNWITCMTGKIFKKGNKKTDCVI